MLLVWRSVSKTCRLCLWLLIFHATIRSDRWSNLCSLVIMEGVRTSPGTTLSWVLTAVGVLRVKRRIFVTALHCWWVKIVHNRLIQLNACCKSPAHYAKPQEGIEATARVRDSITSCHSSREHAGHIVRLGFCYRVGGNPGRTTKRLSKVRPWDSWRADHSRVCPSDLPSAPKLGQIETTFLAESDWAFILKLVGTGGLLWWISSNNAHTVVIAFCCGPGGYSL